MNYSEHDPQQLHTCHNSLKLENLSLPFKVSFICFQTYWAKKYAVCVREKYCFTASIRKGLKNVTFQRQQISSASPINIQSFA